MKITKLLFLLCLLVVSGTAVAQAPVLFFSDLIAGPASGNSDTTFSATGGVYVMLYGNHLDSPTAVKLNAASCLTTVSAPSAWMWYERMVVKLGTSCTSGNFTVTTAAGTSNGLPFTVRSGNIFYVSTTGNDSNAGTFASPWATLIHGHLAIAAGDTVYGENGTTATVDDGTGWNTCYQLAGNAGTSGNSKAIIAYPGATVSIGSSAANVCTGIRSTGQGSDYWVFAELKLAGSGVAINPYGDIDWRIIGNTVTCPNAGVTDQAGCMDLGGQQSYSTTTHMYRVEGNDIEHAADNNAPGSVTGLYHGFYLSEFHNDVDIGWNTIAFVMGGRCYQQNVNDGPGAYDLHFHDNLIHDCPEDGIVQTTVDPSKGTVEYYNNVIYNAGKGPNSSDGGGAWNCMLIEGYENSGVTGESGVIHVYNNTMYGCGTITSPNDGFGETGIFMWNPGTLPTSKSVDYHNNIAYATVAAANYFATDGTNSGVSGADNIFFGNGVPPTGTGLTGSLNSNPQLVNPASSNFHLSNASSPAVRAGTTATPIPTFDHDGITRSSPPSIGAFELQVTDVYVAQSSAGGNTGVDCADARAASSLAAGDWSAGTTIHLCGTFTVAASTNVITSQGAGLSSAPITLKWESGATLTSPAWGTLGNSAIRISHAWIVVDGGSTTNSITATANGSGLAHQQDGTGVSVNASNVTVQNMNITNIYVHNSTSDTACGCGSAISAANGGSNLQILNNTIDQVFVGFDDAYQNGDATVVFSGNTVDHFNWGTHIGNNSTAGITGISLHNNHLKNMNNWDTTTDAFHHDGLFVVQNNTSANITGTQIYNNLFDGTMSTCSPNTCATAWIFTNTGTHGLFVYNNILIGDGSSFLTEGGITGDTDYEYYNNYFKCSSSAISGGLAMNFSNVSTFIFKDNAVDNCSTGSTPFTFAGLSSTTFDYNDYKGWTSGETHSLNSTSLSVTSAGIPLANSPLLHNGTSVWQNLNTTGSLCSTLALCSDFKGVSRPTSGTNNWDAGAYMGGITDIYFNHSSAGLGDGTSCANARAYSSHVIGDDTPNVVLHICGTGTAEANGATVFTSLASGTNGLPITLKFETGAVLQAPYFAFTGGIVISQNFWVIDGGTNGVIENTLNGSSTATCIGGACTQQQGSELIVVSGHDDTVKNLSALDAYVHKEDTPLSNDASSAQSGNTGIEIDGNNDVITGVTCHDAYSCLSEGGNVTTGVSIDHNTLTFCNHCITVGVSSGTVTGVQIHDNDISSMYNWDNPTNDYHHNGIMTFSSTGSCVTTDLYNNYIHGMMSRDTTYGATHVTGWIFQEFCAQGSRDWNNVLEADPDGGATVLNYPANGYITEGGSGDSGSTYFYNNTIIGHNNGGNCLNVGTTGGTVNIFNNITDNCGNPIFVQTGVTMNIDNNVYNNVAGDAWVIGGAQFSSFSGWKTACSCDAHSPTPPANELLNGTPPPYTVQTGSAAISEGITWVTNVPTGWATGAPFTQGVLGACGAGCVTRPGSGAQTAGAYPFVLNPSTAIPTFNPVTGTYLGPRAVTISDSTGGATICYTVDGSTPTGNGAGTCTHGTTYTTTVTVTTGETIKAIGTSSGLSDSAVGSAAYVILPIGGAIGNGARIGNGAVVR